MRQSVTELCKLSGTAAFEPHVTLVGDLGGDPARTWRLLRDLWPAGGIDAKVTGVARTDAYYMALFLDLEMPPEVIPLRAALAEALGVAPPPFRPHLSLAYGHAPALKTPDVAARTQAEFMGRTIRFDRVCVVASAQNMAISDWRILHALPL